MSVNFDCSSRTRGGSASGNNPIAAPAFPAIATKVCEHNGIRKELFLINTGLTVVYVGLGYQPSNVDYSFPLAPCQNTIDDGTGEKWSSDIWQGEIYILAPVGAVGAKVVFTELT